MGHRNVIRITNRHNTPGFFEIFPDLAWATNLDNVAVEVRFFSFGDDDLLIHCSQNTGDIHIAAYWAISSASTYRRRHPHAATSQDAQFKLFKSVRPTFVFDMSISQLVIQGASERFAVFRRVIAPHLQSDVHVILCMAMLDPLCELLLHGTLRHTGTRL